VEDRAPDVKVADAGHDWRAEIGASSNSGRSVDLARAREPGRGREANTPEQIPPRGWSDILWRVLWSISADRILSTSGGVALNGDGVVFSCSRLQPPSSPASIRAPFEVTVPEVQVARRAAQQGAHNPARNFQIPFLRTWHKPPSSPIRPAK
jgi:hypothetical protein